MNHVLVLHCCKNQEQQQQLPHLGKSIIKQLLNIDQNLNLHKNEKIACFDHLIQTKYYDATLSFSLLTLTVDSILNENSSSDYLMNSLLSLNHSDDDSDASSKSYHPHALILTFDDEMMHRECDQLSQALNKCIQICRSKFHQNLEVCLCVSLQHVSDRENFYAALNELTIDEQFELVRQQQVQSQELKTDDDEEEEASDSIFEEKFGSDRVWEALKSTMWPHMDKPTLLQSQQQQAPVYSDNTGEESSQHDKEMLALEELMSQVFQTEEDLQSDEEQSTEPLKSSPVETTTTSTTHVPVQQEKTKTTGANPEVNDAQQFDQLLQAMLHMRRNAGSMVDQERKQRAADLAMSLLSMLDAEK